MTCPRTARTAALLLLGGVAAWCAVPDARAAAADDWPSFRGSPAMTGRASGATLPAKLSRLWTFECGSAVDSTAAIVGDRVFLGTSKGEVFCIGLQDGKQRWKVTGEDAVTASPCVHKGTVYVGDESGNFLALNAADGKKVWAFKAEDKIVSSAVVAGDAVLFGSYDNHLYSLDAKTGAKKWAFKADSFVHCSPCVSDGRVVIAGCDGHIRLIDLATGKQRAAVETEGNFAANAAADAGLAFVGSMSGEYYAVQLKDAKVAWQQRDKGGGACFAGAAVSGGANRVVFASRGRKVFAVDGETGEVKWTFVTKGKVDSSPVIVKTMRAAEHLLVGSSDGNLYRLQLSDGKSVWKFTAGSAITASPAVRRGRLVIGTEDGAVYCFGPKRGEGAK